MCNSTRSRKYTRTEKKVGIKVTLEEAILLIANVAKNNGGRAMLVGGYVRDKILGLEPKDADIEVYYIYDWGKFERSLLEKGANLDYTGKSFQVLKVRLESHEIDVSIPRIDKKIGEGHKGFEITGNPFATFENACSRRDFTCNAILSDPLTGELIDPFNGKEALEERVLRRANALTFPEDPLRVLRGMQFASRFDMEVSPATAILCEDLLDEYDTLPKERISEEWMKAMTKCQKPSRAMKFLWDTGWVLLYPELNNMCEVEQEPEWHPEGDVWDHTCYVMDALREQETWDNWSDEEKAVLMFSALLHDIGKPSTTHVEDRYGISRIVSPGHAEVGGPIARNFLENIGIHKDIVDKVVKLVENHMAHTSWEGTPSSRTVRRLAQKLYPATIEQLVCLMEADYSGRPPLPKGKPATIEALLEKAVEIQVSTKPVEPILKGRHLIDMGLTPSPEFGSILNRVFEKQLDGDVSTLDEALIYAKSII